MKLYRTREGDISAVDTRTQLSTLGSETAPGPLLVPTGMTHIVGVRVSVIENFAAATSMSALVRLEGPGLKNGPEAFAAGCSGVPVATGGNGVMPAVTIPVNIPVISANEILIFAEMCGTDIGACTAMVTLIFASGPGPGASEHRTFTVEGDIASADTRTLLTTQGSVTAPSPVVPKGMKKIDKIVFAASTEGLADGSQGYFLRLGGNAVKNGEQAIAISGVARIAVQSGSDAAPQICPPMVLEDVDIEVSESDTITVAVEGAGTDTGTGRAVVTLVYA